MCPKHSGAASVSYPRRIVPKVRVDESSLRLEQDDVILFAAIIAKVSLQHKR